MILLKHFISVTTVWSSSLSGLFVLLYRGVVEGGVTLSLSWTVEGGVTLSL